VSEQPPRKPMAVGEVLERFLARSGLATRLKQAQIIPEWAALVGPQIAAVTQPESVALDGTLFVRVATSPWMNELQLMAPAIMARINAGRGAGRIRTIRWLLAP
jgi:predicted nucleic acid-binding Zn ribbon protein